MKPGSRFGLVGNLSFPSFIHNSAPVCPLTQKQRVRANTHLPQGSEFRDEKWNSDLKNRLSNQIDLCKLFTVSEPISLRSVVALLQGCCDFKWIA